MAETLAIQQVREALGDSGSVPAWTNAELAVRLDQNFGMIASTVENCFLELQAEAAGRTSYAIGSTSATVTDIFKQLDILVNRWSARASIERGQRERQSTESAPPVAVVVEWWF